MAGFLGVLLVVSCGGSKSSPPDAGSGDAGVDAGTDTGLDAGADLGFDAGPDEVLDEPDAGEPDGGADLGPDQDLPTSCNFGYESEFVYDLLWFLEVPPPPSPRTLDLDSGMIDHLEPDPPSTSLMRPASPFFFPLDQLVVPDYVDNLPLFGRAGVWTTPTRCYETPLGVRMLREAEAYDLYRTIAEATTGVPFDDAVEVRSVVGLRGAYPGTFAWHGNWPDRFNDTLALLWVDTGGAKHLREWPVNTDTGAYPYSTMSSLKPNRRYAYKNGWHNTYNALHIDITDYPVRDDANSNGHWDSDRNGWLAPSSAADFDRVGSGHNIHTGSRSAPLGTAKVAEWSAGCQVIPGILNWKEFISNAWTGMDHKVSYFLVDARDVPVSVWADCPPDGTQECPYPISQLPFEDSQDLSLVTNSYYDGYNCSTADESGPEVVYVFTTDIPVTLTVSVASDPADDPDVHLLDGEDPDACVARDHNAFTVAVGPGRYWIVVDTFVSGGVELAGPYTLSVDFQ